MSVAIGVVMLQALSYMAAVGNENSCRFYLIAYNTYCWFYLQEKQMVSRKLMATKTDPSRNHHVRILSRDDHRVRGDIEYGRQGTSGNRVRWTSVISSSFLSAIRFIRRIKKEIRATG
ncbi:hypothetical protein RRG08_042774 [Elysia crispata]|uniref:Secreted protein n=1 Tax=Elysia crispata TaxID=231223 RepID=A0AAE0XQT2_9GAST|nr:hypothetical protein RRG08_042774 [Elysia crispata]